MITFSFRSNFAGGKAKVWRCWGKIRGAHWIIILFIFFSPSWSFSLSPYALSEVKYPNIFFNFNFFFFFWLMLWHRSYWHTFIFLSHHQLWRHSQCWFKLSSTLSIEGKGKEGEMIENLSLPFPVPSNSTALPHHYV